MENVKNVPAMSRGRAAMIKSGVSMLEPLG